MSTRPVRTRKPPNRLTTRASEANKITQVETKVRKRASEANKITQVETKVRKRASKANKNTKPIKKIDIIKNIRNKKFMKLASLYQIMEETQIQRNIEGGSYRGELLSLINKQQEVIEKSTIKIEPKKFTFKSDDIKLDFLVLMWLDMSHDATVIKGWRAGVTTKIPIYHTFREFLDLKISNILVPDTPKIKITEFISKLRGVGAIDYNTNNSNIDITTSPGFEGKIKTSFENLFDLKDILKGTSSESIGKYLKNKNNPIYISVDQESDKQSPISLLIIKSKYENIRSNGTKKSLYGIKSLVTLANIIDPGALKGKKGSLLRDVSQLFERPPRVFSTFVDITKFNLDGKIIEIIPSSTTYGKYDLKIGTKTVEGGKTKGKAQEKNDELLKISKFCGDFLQILSVAAAQKTINCTVGTGDAMMATMHLFIQKYVLGEPNPRILFDKSYTTGRSNIIICGFSEQFIPNYVKNKAISPTNKTGVTRPARGRTNNKGVNQPAKRPNAQQNAQKAKRKRTPNAQQNVPMPKRARQLTPVSRGAPSRNNTAGRQSQQVNRPRSNTGSITRSSSVRPPKQISVKGKNLIVSNASSGITKRRHHNSVTQNRSGNGKVESITRTVSAKPESIMKTASAKTESITRTVSARQGSATSNSARSNQTRG